MHSPSRRFWSSLSYIGLAAALAPALYTGCGPEFNNCESKRSCPSTGGGGDGGDGQSDSAGTGGTRANGGDAATGGGTGTTSGGTNAGSSGADSAGVGGDSGSGGSPSSAGAGASDPGEPGGETGAGGRGEGGSSNAVGAGGEAGGGGSGGDGEVTPSCGDGVVRDLEQCDDGNQDPADGCRPNCTWGPKQVIAGANSSCVLFGDGSAKCWGGNSSGQLGQGDLADRGDVPGELGAALKQIQIAGKAAKFTALAIRNTTCGVSAGELWCWGGNVHGDAGAGLADGNPVLNPHRVELSETVRSVAVGFMHACALLASGQVKCWGLTALLGNGRSENDNIGDAPGEIGPSLPAVSLPESATELVAGNYHTCAVLKSGAVACWGDNNGGKLGLGNTDSFDYGRVAPATQPIVNLGSGTVALQIGAGQDHTCALLSAQAPILKCWGRGTYGVLGYGDDTTRGEAPEQLGSNLPVVPITTSSDPVAAVYGLTDATCVLLKSGSVKCWGSGFDPVLAQPELVGSLGNIGDAPNELSQLSAIDLGAGAQVRSLAVGASHACALLSTGLVKCWGSNESGQLGIGSTETIGDARAELGSALKAVPLD